MTLMKLIGTATGAALGAVVAGLYLDALGHMRATVAIATVIAASLLGAALGALVGWSDGPD